MEEITQQFWRASDKRRMCRITMTGEPLPRTVHPYGICQTSAGKIALVCWQSMGFTKAGGKEGFRNLILSDIEDVEVLELHFKVDPSFNPFDPQYKDWVFYIKD